jgi:site-specific DNA-methyltransferase (adenine-specific)
MKTHETKLGTAFNADCFEVMKLMPDGCVDMILCDPPYGTTACAWDSIIPFEKLWLELNRICKPNGAMVLTASQPFTSALVMSNVKNFRYCWVWDKKKGGNIMNLKNQPYKVHEDVCVFSQKPHAYFPIMVDQKERTGKTYSKGEANGIPNYGDERTYKQKYPKSILEASNANQKGKIHPTQKPVALFEYLIKTYTNEGDLVFDPTAGSLTTAVAAEALNRRWAVCEMDEGYFDKGVERL